MFSEEFTKLDLDFFVDKVFLEQERREKEPMNLLEKLDGLIKTPVIINEENFGDVRKVQSWLEDTSFAVSKIAAENFGSDMQSYQEEFDRLYYEVLDNYAKLKKRTQKKRMQEINKQMQKIKDLLEKLSLSLAP